MKNTNNRLWYSQPASEWLEALPIGNGRLGAMVYGGTDHETIQLNEGTIWAGEPHQYDQPDAYASLPEIRSLVFAGKWKEAQDLINDKFMGLPAGQMPYQNAGFLDIDFPKGQTIDGYSRDLDLENAVTSVSYFANGVRYTREALASNPDGVIAIRLTASTPGALSFSATLRSPRGTACSATKKGIVLNDRAGFLNEPPGAIRYRIEACILATGGATNADAQHIHVKNANEAVILVAIGASYVRYDNADGDENALVTEALDKAANKSFDAIERAHVADYQRLFNRFSIDLGSSALADRPTNERIATHGDDADPALAALYCQYGRYLLISSSREGGLPATLQGLWNDSLTPPWGSKFTININTEMNYWPAGPANLIECYDPLLAHLKSISETGARTAKLLYGVGGWVTHHNTDAWAGTAPVDRAYHGMWQTGGAWLSKSIWDRYEYTGDVETLRENYPIMRGAAQFFVESLVPEPTHGWLVTNPSNSPENAHHPEVTVCVGPTMDMQIVRDLLLNCAKAASLLGTDSEFRTTLLATEAKLPPNQVGKQGQLQEWLDDWDCEAPELDHRHTSHLYGVFPSDQINPATPDLFAGARKTLEMRGDESTGWAMAWRVNLWARLLDGEHAHKMLTMLLSSGRTAPNMFDLHPPFQIDGNFGGANGILEMLVQTKNGVTSLLPALPAAWPTGNVSGVLTRGGFEISLNWKDGALVGGTVTSKNGGTCKLRYGTREATVVLAAGERRGFDGALVVAVR